ncbi:MAG: hypothetical protein HXY22_06610 [Alphaproteobacteria bacterium]|nr:hypothetical protein [Alphaproteobacteria bacterium]
MGPIAVRLSQFFLLITPFLTGLAFVLVSMIPFSVSGGLFVTPAFALMPIYFWGMYRPDLMPPLAVFGIGLFQDLVTAGPLGLWPAVYLFCYMFLISQRLILLSVMAGRTWAGFTIVMGLAAFFAWTIGSAAYGMVLSPLSLLIQALLSIAIYPLIARVLLFLHTRIQRELG